jgi:transaldolase
MEIHEQTLVGARYLALEKQGAQPQRPLWASTSVKNPAYPDTMYVDELVVRGVVNTMPMGTLEAEADHGDVPEGHWDTVTGTYDAARAAIKAVEDAGVSIDAVTKQLEDEGVESFVEAWEKLLDYVASAMKR